MSTLCDKTSEPFKDTEREYESGVQSQLEWLLNKNEELYENGGLPAVEICDENGHPFLMRDADGLFLTRNVAPDVMTRHSTFEARDSDVLVATYPKCGTHWAWEITSMMLQGSHTLLEDTMKAYEFFPSDMLDNLPSPRVIATHLPFSRVPRDLLSRGCKIVWIVRNPADCAVSFYAFAQKLKVFDYSGQWSGFLGMFLDGHVPYGSWFEHVQNWMTGLESGHNILLVRYENLLSNFREEASRIARFLNVEVSDSMLDSLQRETSFANMAQNKFDFTTVISKDGTPAIYRNGKSNAWRASFTKEQTSRMENAYRELSERHRDRLGYSFQ